MKSLGENDYRKGAPWQLLASPRGKYTFRSESSSEDEYVKFMDKLSIQTLDQSPAYPLKDTLYCSVADNVYAWEYVAGVSSSDAKQERFELYGCQDNGRPIAIGSGGDSRPYVKYGQKVAFSNYLYSQKFLTSGKTGGEDAAECTGTSDGDVCWTIERVGQ